MTRREHSTSYLIVGVVAIMVVIAGMVLAGVGPGTATSQSPTASTNELQDGGDTTLSTASSLGDAETKLAGDADDLAGWSVAAGDVNGDGETDLLVGAQTSDGDETSTGAAYLFYGPVDRGDLSLADADASFTGISEGDRAGFAVDLGDLNGDGFDDLVVGAPLNDSIAPNAGASYVVYGDRSLDGEQSLADADTTVAGEGLGDRSGWDVSVVQNATADGESALAVGAPLNDSVGEDAGAAYLLSGTPPAGTVSLSEATTTVTGEGIDDRAGWSVADGDVDGDGVAELLVGAPHNNSTASNAGAAYVVSTDETGAVDLSDAAKLAGVGNGDRAGFALATDDVTGDGADDVLVGAPYNNSAAQNAGVVYVVAGDESADDATLADADLQLTGAGEGDLAGWSVASAGEATCDEYADVLVGAPYNDSVSENSGAAYLVAGGSTGTISLAEADAALLGEGEGDRAGQALAAAGDATGDGNGDVLVGAPYNASGGENAGAAYLVAGDCPVEQEEEEPEAPQKPTPPEEPDESFRADITFECTEVTVSADEYDTVYLVFADETTRTFTGPYSGEQTFAASSGEEVIRKVIVRSGDRVVRATNANYDACFDGTPPQPTPVDPVPDDGDETEEPPQPTPETPTPGTETPEEPEPGIEYVNCTAVNVTGEFEDVYLSTAYYATDGFATSYVNYGPVDGSKIIDLGNGSGEGINGQSYIGNVAAYENGTDQGEPTLENASSFEFDECDEVQPERPNSSFVEYERVDEGTYNVTFEYTNPNNDTLAVGTASEFVEGTTDDTPPDALETGTHQFTVTWQPETEDERLVWEVALDQYGYENETIRASSPPPETETETGTEQVSSPTPETEPTTTTEADDGEAGQIQPADEETTTDEDDEDEPEGAEETETTA